MQLIIVIFLVPLLSTKTLINARHGNNVKRGYSTVKDYAITYECTTENRCQRTKRPIGAIDRDHRDDHPSIQACRLVCSRAAGLWPVPTGTINVGTNYNTIDPHDFEFVNLNRLDVTANRYVEVAKKIFLDNVRSLCGCTVTNCLTINEDKKRVKVHFKIESSDVELGWDTNESYGLEIGVAGQREVNVIITSQTVYGARHALETLSQLIAPSWKSSNDTIDLVIIDSAIINDKPIFRHRGLLIDTARNFLPVNDIKRTIDGLAASKMNVLHWHATDSQSFPLMIYRVPLMSLYGAYGPDQIYTNNDMLDVKSYANARGVRVIMEIDSPSHAGAGWEWGEEEGLGKLAVCVNQQPWRQYCIQPPCGQLNPVNENLYNVLRDIYKELLTTFGRNGMMHLGGDELFIDCWKSSEEITSTMTSMGMGLDTKDFLQLWSNVHNRQLEILNQELPDKSTNKAIVWSSHLTEPDNVVNYLNRSKFIIQTWVEADKDLNQALLDLDYQLIISTKDAWYLDHGFWGNTKYHTWRDAYKNIIPQHPNVLGGEACMWGEYVTGGALDSRVWPRTAAVAERLWSDPPKNTGTTAEAEPRLQAHVDRLTRRTLGPDALAPEWCNQHEGQCM